MGDRRDPDGLTTDVEIKALIDTDNRGSVPFTFPDRNSQNIFDKYLYNYLDPILGDFYPLFINSAKKNAYLTRDEQLRMRVTTIDSGGYFSKEDASEEVICIFASPKNSSGRNAFENGEDDYFLLIKKYGESGQKMYDIFVGERVNGDLRPLSFCKNFKKVGGINKWYNTHSKTWSDSYTPIKDEMKELFDKLF